MIPTLALLVFFGGLIGMFFGLMVLIFWVVMLVDAIQNPRLDSTQKIVWVLVIIFLSALGALLYFLLGRNR